MTFTGINASSKEAENTLLADNSNKIFQGNIRIFQSSILVLPISTMPGALQILNLYNYAFLHACPICKKVDVHYK